MIALSLAVWALLTSFAFTLVILNAMLYRRYRQLDELLMQLCTDAWMMRRWPLIQQYLDYAGLQLVVVNRRGDRYGVSP